MWIARDKDGSLWLYEKEPLGKGSQSWIAAIIGKNERLDIDEDWFPEVKWEDEEPRELILKPINKK